MYESKKYLGIQNQEYTVAVSNLEYSTAYMDMYIPYTHRKMPFALLFS